MDGLVTFYDGAEVRAYPPLSTYLFAAAGRVAYGLSNSAAPSDALLNVLIKLPAIVADVATAVLLVWQAGKQTAVWRILIAALYLLNPAVWYVSVYWGQTDAIYLFFMIAGLMLLARGRVIPAWVCCGLSLGVKLQGLPLVFLFFVWTWVQEGRWALIKGMTAALGTGVILTLPWLVNGRILEIVEAITSDSLRVVQSAYNGWYFVLGERARTEEASRTLDILPISYGTASLVLFFIVVLLMTILIVKRREQVALPIAAVFLSLAAFLFLTDMRERYLFPVLPLLLWSANQQRRLLWLYLILTITWLFNLVTIASFAPEFWTNLVAWERPYPTHIAILKGIASVVSAIHLLIFGWLSWFLVRK
jgi:Gpi18-like mannosyltransferase